MIIRNYMNAKLIHFRKPLPVKKPKGEVILKHFSSSKQIDPQGKIKSPARRLPREYIQEPKGSRMVVEKNFPANRQRRIQTVGDEGIYIPTIKRLQPYESDLIEDHEHYGYDEDDNYHYLDYEDERAYAPTGK